MRAGAAFVVLVAFLAVAVIVVAGHCVCAAMGGCR